MPHARDPLCFDAGALFADFRQLDDDFDAAAARHWSFSFRHAEFDALAAAGEELLDAMIAALGREPAELKPQLTRGRIEIDSRGQQRLGAPAAEIEFTDALAEPELAQLHRAFAEFCARHGMAYEGVRCYEAFELDFEPSSADLGDLEFEPPRKKPAGKRTAKPTAPRKPAKNAPRKDSDKRRQS